ncbi:MAG: hypothetical protein HY770_08745 [Chitinivibrionia bacterium]|nr:hypothetical protein [Chitinivibrionia bacterium]
MKLVIDGKLPIVLRVIGALSLATGLALTQDRAGDWFFRSETFSDRFAFLLLAVRLTAGFFGIVLLVWGGTLGRTLARRWSTLPEPGKLTVLTLALALCGIVLFAASQYFREQMIFLESITQYKTKVKILGFTAVIQTDEMRLADFLTCIYFAIAGSISYVMHSLHRLKLISANEEQGSSRRTMWLLFSLGFFFLVLDEYVSLHEFIGDNIPFFSRIGITSHPDDLMIILYFIGALGVMVWFRRYLLECKPARTLLLTGVAIHFLATISDGFIDFYFIEEAFEELAVVFYLGAMAQYALNEIVQSKRRA